MDTRKSIKELYESGVNIQQYFQRLNNTKKNDINAILLSYDYQAGNYIEEYNNENCIEEVCYNGKKVTMSNKKLTEITGKLIADEIDKFNPDSVLEVGTGEGTILKEVIDHLKNKDVQYTGIDISLSRLLFARKFLKENQKDVNLIMADLFHLPFSDNQFDVVFLRNCLESNTGREKEALTELIRIANKCVILIEPSYTLGNEQTKKRIKEFGYIDNIDSALEGLNILKYEPFGASIYYNNTALIVIGKESITREKNKSVQYCCTQCKTSVNRVGGGIVLPRMFLYISNNKKYSVNDT